MKTYTGVLKKVGAYKLDKPVETKYGLKTYRYAAETDIGWIAFGIGDKDNFLVQDDDDKWKILGAGSEVVIKYTEDSYGKKAKKSDMMIINLIQGEAFQVNAPVQANKPQTRGTVNPAERGQLMNLAIQEFGSVHVATQGINHAWVQDFFEFQSLVGSLMLGEQVPESKPTQGDATEQLSFALADDDIPF